MGADRAGYADADHRTSIISFNILYNPNPHAVAGTSPRPPTKCSSRACEIGFTEGKPVMLHPHFITAALNDVYGIQSRSGCSCTGPLGHRLFGIKLDGDFKNEMLTAVIDHNVHSLKLGWARINFNVSFVKYLLLSFYVTSKSASLFVSISSMKTSSPLSSEPSSSLPCTVGGCCLFIIATLRAGSSRIARLFLDRCA
jgi:hypothetical protein